MNLYCPLSSQRPIPHTLKYYSDKQRMMEEAYRAAGHDEYLEQCKFWNKCQWIYNIMKCYDPDPNYDWSFPKIKVSAWMILSNFTPLQLKALEQATRQLCRIGFDVLDRPQVHTEEKRIQLVEWGESLGFLTYGKNNKGGRWTQIYQLFSYKFFVEASIRPVNHQEYRFAFSHGPPYPWAIVKRGEGLNCLVDKATAADRCNLKDKEDARLSCDARATTILVKNKKRRRAPVKDEDESASKRRIAVKINSARGSLTPAERISVKPSSSSTVFHGGRPATQSVSLLSTDKIKVSMVLYPELKNHAVPPAKLPPPKPVARLPLPTTPAILPHGNDVATVTFIKRELPQIECGGLSALHGIPTMISGSDVRRLWPRGQTPPARVIVKNTLKSVITAKTAGVATGRAPTAGAPAAGAPPSAAAPRAGVSATNRANNTVHS